ncbi:MAG: ankyrin repeat domain-containing protein [Candidatus Babeliales bacterium]
MSIRFVFACLFIVCIGTQKVLSFDLFDWDDLVTNVMSERLFENMQQKENKEIAALSEQITSLLTLDDLSHLKEESPLLNCRLYQDLPHFLPKLLAKKADPNVKEESLGYVTFPLFYAERNIGCFKQLLEAGANPNNWWGEGDSLKTPLLSATSDGNIEVMRLLLRCGANPRVVTHGMLTTTPLQSAVGTGIHQLALQKNRRAMIEVLLQYGANPEQRNEEQIDTLARMRNYFSNKDSFASPAYENPDEYKQIGRKIVEYIDIKHTFLASSFKPEQSDEWVQIPAEIVEHIMPYVVFRLFNEPSQ